MCSSLVACTAQAQDGEADEDQPSAERAFEVQLQAGPRYGTNDLNLGFGGRTGFLLQNHVWLGGTFDYFLGIDESLTPTVTGKFRTWNAGGEVGYELAVTDGLWLRPYLGFGLARAVETICGPGVTGERCVSPAGSNHAVFNLGGLLRYAMGLVTVSADVRRRGVVGSWDFADSAVWYSAWVFAADVGVAL